MLNGMKQLLALAGIQAEKRKKRKRKEAMTPSGGMEPSATIMASRQTKAGRDQRERKHLFDTQNNSTLIGNRAGRRPKKKSSGGGAPRMRTFQDR